MTVGGTTLPQTQQAHTGDDARDHTVPGVAASGSGVADPDFDPRRPDGPATVAELGGILDPEPAVDQPGPGAGRRGPSGAVRGVKTGPRKVDKM